jgi:hypothetical protein
MESAVLRSSRRGRGSRTIRRVAEAGDSTVMDTFSGSGVAVIISAYISVITRLLFIYAEACVVVAGRIGA